MKKIFYFAFLLTSVLSFAQGKVKIPTYEPIANVNTADVLTLVNSSFHFLKKSDKSVTIEKIDDKNNIYQTGYYTYVAMMMIRRCKIVYELKNGLLHISLTDLELQNQVQDGKWEKSKISLGADKKILADIAFHINEINNDKVKLNEKRALLYSDFSMAYKYIIKENRNNVELQKNLLNEQVKYINSGLVVKDVDFNESNNGKGIYVITSKYDIPKEENNGVRDSLFFFNYSNDEWCETLNKSKVIHLQDIKTWELNENKTYVINNNGHYVVKHVYETKDKDEIIIKKMSSETVLPIVCDVLYKEKIKIKNVNLMDNIISAVVLVKDKSSNLEMHIDFEFYNGEMKISVKDFEVEDTGITSTFRNEFASNSSINMAKKLAALIKESNQSNDLELLKKRFYTDLFITNLINNSDQTTTVNKKRWQMLSTKYKQ